MFLRGCQEVDWWSKADKVVAKGVRLNNCNINF